MSDLSLFAQRTTGWATSVWAASKKGNSKVERMSVSDPGEKIEWEAYSEPQKNERVPSSAFDNVINPSHRVLGFFSCRPNWDPPPHHPEASVPPSFGGHTPYNRPFNKGKMTNELVSLLIFSPGFKTSLARSSSVHDIFVLFMSTIEHCLYKTIKRPGSAVRCHFYSVSNPPSG